MPSPELVKRALAAIKRRATDVEYFFDHLSSPTWIEPLREEGLFADPPKPVFQGESVRFPLWPQSRYLARMAAQAPRLVLDTILKIETDNIHAYEDFAEAALAMPPQLAAEMVPLLMRGLELPYRSLLPRSLGQLVRRLAEGGQTESAISLSLSLFAVHSYVLHSPESEDGERTVILTEARARMDEWEYKEVLGKCAPVLLSAVGERFLAVLFGLLEDTIKASHPDAVPPEDYSFVWRPAIEEHPQNHMSHGLTRVLVSAVRDASEQLARNQPDLVPRLVTELEARSWHIFKRLALHLLRLFPSTGSGILIARVTNTALFEEPSFRHEYALLLGQTFKNLSPAQKRKVFSWIRSGPSIETASRWLKDGLGRMPSTDDIEQYRKAWTLKRLSIIRESLSPKWKRLYETMVVELGEPEHPDFASYSSGVLMGPTSPIGADELGAMDVQTLVSFLSTWKPSHEFMGPTYEGLSRELAQTVASDPEKYAAGGALFKASQPAYVRGVLSGLKDAAKESKRFDWRRVLQLCEWVVEQPRGELSTGQRLGDQEGSTFWGWTRQTTAELLRAGLSAQGDVATPFELRSDIWKVLGVLVDDPDPTPEEDGPDGTASMDPSTLSINTTRGVAMHAVIAYAAWVRRHEISQGTVVKGMSHEVRNVLEQHLARDVGLSIRAVYGQRLPTLVWLDREWVAANLAKIFPEAETSREYWNAAWASYLAFAQPHVQILQLLEREYARAVQQIGTQSTRRKQIADPNERLAEHLMVYYMHGHLSLDHPEGLLPMFFSNAPDSVRADALEFAGRSLYSAPEQGWDVPSETIERLRNLWLQRVAVARHAVPGSHTKELAAFGWWFASGRFDTRWSLAQLHQALELSVAVDVDHFVVEQLGRLAPVEPKICVDCLRLIVRGDQEGWRAYSWREHAEAVLRTAVSSEDPEARELAKNLINYLGAQGRLDFGHLLR